MMYSNEVKNTNFWDLMRDVLFDRLDEYEGVSFYGADMATELCMNDNNDGCFVIDIEGAKSFIGDNWDISADVVQDYKDNYGEALPEKLDPFSSPCAFTYLMEEYAFRELLSNVTLIDDNWNDEIELTEKNIDQIKKQINIAHKDKFADREMGAR